MDQETGHYLPTGSSTPDSAVLPHAANRGTWRSPAFSTPTAPTSTKTVSSTPTYKYRVVNKNAGSQTMFSLPPIIPPEVEEMLKPYFSEVEVGNVSVDSNDPSFNSFRRKLFFNADQSDLSPVKFSGRYTTPSPQVSRILPRIEWSSEKVNFLQEDNELSSPDVSPIKTSHVIESATLNESHKSNSEEVSMVTVGSTKGDEVEEMLVSLEENHQMFSSMAMTNQTDCFTGGVRVSAESGYSSMSVDVSSNSVPNNLY